MPDFITDRKTVANLLRSVRLGNCSVREAMLLYPKDTTDESLVAAYHALIHYEADEDLRRRDPLYKEEQDGYILNCFLKMICQILSWALHIPHIRLSA